MTFLTVLYRPKKKKKKNAPGKDCMSTQSLNNLVLNLGHKQGFSIPVNFMVQSTKLVILNAFISDFSVAEFGREDWQLSSSASVCMYVCWGWGRGGWRGEGRSVGAYWMRSEYVRFTTH